MAFWGVLIKQDEPYFLRAEDHPRRLRISQATLAEKEQFFHPSSGRNVVRCKVGTKDTICLCALSLKTVDSCELDLEFEESEDIIFTVGGFQGVHLTGYYLSSTSTAAVTATSDCNVDSFEEGNNKETGDDHSTECKSEQNILTDPFVSEIPLHLPHNSDGPPQPRGVLIKPGKAYTLKGKGQPRRLRLLQATLAKKESYYQPYRSRSFVSCSVGNKEAVYLCGLSRKTLTSCQLDLEFEELEDIVFSVCGFQEVYLAGYYLSSAATSTHNFNFDSFGEENNNEIGNDHFIERRLEQDAVTDPSVSETPLHLPQNSDGSPQPRARAEQQDTDKKLGYLHVERQDDPNIYAYEKESIILEMKNEVEKNDDFLENVEEKENYSRTKNIHSTVDEQGERLHAYVDVDGKISYSSSPNESKKRKRIKSEDYEQNLDYDIDDMQRSFDENVENCVMPDTNDESLLDSGSNICQKRRKITREVKREGKRKRSVVDLGLNQEKSAKKSSISEQVVLALSATSISEASSCDSRKRGRPTKSAIGSKGQTIGTKTGS